MLRRVEVFHLEETAVSNASRWECVSLEKLIKVQAGCNREREREGRGKDGIGGVEKLESPQNIHRWWCVPDHPPAWTHSLSSLRVYYNQPCLETTEILQMTNTVKSSLPDMLPLMRRWYYGYSKPISSNLLQGKQWSNCSSHTPGKERVDFPMFSTLIKLAPMNANLESTWKWAFPFNKNMQLAGTLHPLPVPGKRGSTAFGAPGDNAISNPCHYRQQAFSVFRVILIYHPWALIKFIQWNSENTQDILIYIILLYVKGPSTTHDAQGVSANTRSLPFLSGHSTLYSSCLKSHETSHQPHFPLH